MRHCSKCGFPLGTRPRLLERDGVCMMCINAEKKKTTDFKSRQLWLTAYIQEQLALQENKEYDCLVAVSGGKDSHTIVRRLIENHGIKNPLLVTVTDEFTHTRAGKHNIDNLVTRYDLDHITFRCKPQTFKRETLKDFENELHPLKWIEKKIYETPIQIARNFGIRLVFYGESPAFEMGESEDFDVFHLNEPNFKVIYMGAIYPYSITDSLMCAREIGFKDLDDFNEWKRIGSMEQYTQIDSIAYIIQLWTKYVKFGFQRVTDIATRFVREGKLTKEEAEFNIKQKDYLCDPEAKQDFCDTIGITLQHFNNVVDKHANTDIVEKDKYGNWRVKE